MYEKREDLVAEGDHDAHVVDKVESALGHRHLATIAFRGRHEMRQGHLQHVRHRQRHVAGQKGKVQAKHIECELVGAPQRSARPPRSQGRCGGRRGHNETATAAADALFGANERHRNAHI